MQKGKNLISEVGVNLLCQFCVIMDVKCCFSSLVGGSCSYDPRDRSRSTEVIPFLNCKRDIAGHKSSVVNNWRRNRNRTYFGKSIYILFFGVKPFGINDLSPAPLISWYWVASRIESVPSSSANLEARRTSPKKTQRQKEDLAKVLVIWYGRNWEFLFQLVQVCIHHFSSFSTKQTSCKMAVQSDTSIKALCKHFFVFLFFFFNSFIN